MTQEDKELLLKDLCARLPYGVKIRWERDKSEDKIFDLHLGSIHILLRDEERHEDVRIHAFERTKPYLRPMSSRTEEEDDFIQQCMDIVEDENYHDGFSPSAWSSMADFVNYCNQHHLDYNGLIGKGLALEAPEDMYKNV